MIATKFQLMWATLTKKIGQLQIKDADYLLHRSSVFYHTCSNPLTSLLLNLELAANHQTMDANPYLIKATQNAHYVTELFRQLAPTQTTSYFHVAEALTETIRLLQSRYDQSVSLSHCGSPPTQLWLTGKKLFFQEILLAICHNAIESYQAQTRRFIILTHIDTAQSYQLAVTDGGKGMSLWDRQLIFRDGLSLKKNHQGIGLSVAKRLMAAHFKGKISIFSQPRRGTTVMLEFPKPT